MIDCMVNPEFLIVSVHGFLSFTIIIAIMLSHNSDTFLRATDEGLTQSRIAVCTYDHFL